MDFQSFFMGELFGLALLALNLLLFRDIIIQRFMTNFIKTKQVSKEYIDDAKDILELNETVNTYINFVATSSDLLDFYINQQTEIKFEEETLNHMKQLYDKSEQLIDQLENLSNRLEKRGVTISNDKE